MNPFNTGVITLDAKIIKLAQFSKNLGKIPFRPKIFGPLEKVDSPPEHPFNNQLLQGRNIKDRTSLVILHKLKFVKKWQ